MPGGEWMIRPLVNQSVFLDLPPQETQMRFIVAFSSMIYLIFRVLSQSKLAGRHRDKEIDKAPPPRNYGSGVTRKRNPLVTQCLDGYCSTSFGCGKPYHECNEHSTYGPGYGSFSVSVFPSGMILISMAETCANKDGMHLQEGKSDGKESRRCGNAKKIKQPAKSL